MSTLSFLHSQLFVEPKLPQADLTGQTIIVTGANRGLGIETVRHLINLNAETVVLGVRSLDKGKDAVKQLEQSTGRVGVAKAFELNMSSSQSVKAFVENMKGLPRVDAAVLSAGMYTQDFVLQEGFESTLTVNVINTFLLAILLLPLLRKSSKGAQSPPRITIVSSDRHVMTNLPEWKLKDTLAVMSDPQKAKMNDR
jgi:NAD(P)-dependent dehydrogenase (short-subunit alcohol dehydrogenase family)